MGIGAPIGAFLTLIALDLLNLVTGLVFLALVISGLIMFTHIGGQGVQKFVRGNILAVVFGAIFCGFAQVIAGNIQHNLHP